MAPAMATTAPSTLTASLVTNPANNSVIPKARTTGHGVDAGTSTVSGVPSALWFTNPKAMFFLYSAADNIYDGEDHHPHNIHEVPIDRQTLGALGVLLSYVPKKREKRHRRKSKQAGRYVKCMQADQRVVSSPEQVGLDGQSFVVDQVAPLTSGACKKDRSKNDGQKPPQGEGTHLPSAQKPHGKMNR